MRFAKLAVLFGILTSFTCAESLAEDFFCEVLAVEGSATLTNEESSELPLSEGDLLKENDEVRVGASSSVDLAYDREWSNVIRVEENSKVKLQSIYPAVLSLAEGGVFARLKALPKDSTFDIMTPTAIATVRGTEYRATYDGAETQVYNVSDSEVFVYGIDVAGKQQAEPVIIKRSEATQIAGRGQRPVAPRPMQAHETQRVERFREAIDRKVEQNVRQGKFGKIQDIKQIERHHEQMKTNPGQKNDRVPTMSGDDARKAVNRMQGSDDSEKPSNFVSGQGMQERKPVEMERQAGQDGGGQGRLGEPFFPGGEKKRQLGQEQNGPGQGGFSENRREGGAGDRRALNDARQTFENPSQVGPGGPNQEMRDQGMGRPMDNGPVRTDGKAGQQGKQPDKPAANNRPAPRPRNNR